MGHGTIKRVTDRGFGFIDQGTGQDLFFHSSALENVAFDELRRGDRVEFDTEPDDRGRGDRAVRVRRIDIPSR
jgi:cold shock protein